MSIKNKLTVEIFVELHVRQRKTLAQIGKMFHCSRQRVHQIKKEYEAKKGKITRQIFIDPVTLKTLIEEDKKNTKQIAEMYRTSEQKILRLIRQYHQEYVDGKSSIDVQRIKAENVLSPKMLENLYKIELLTDQEIGEKYGFAASTINGLRKKYHIDSLKTKKLRKIKKELTPEKFDRLYYKEKKTLEEIAKIYQCNVLSILNLKKEYKTKK